MINDEKITTRVEMFRLTDESACKKTFLAVTDTMDLLKGKWKVPILLALSVGGTKRYGELLKMTEGIGTKMLAKELHELEENRLISRKVEPGKIQFVEYSITAYGKTLDELLLQIIHWGTTHRKVVKEIFLQEM